MKRLSPLYSGVARCLAGALLGFLALAGNRSAHGQPSENPEDSTCRVVKIEMTPTDDLQMVVWIEDSAGRYVDTVFITRLTGTYGLGNRPGIMDFNSAWRWPYGRRISTFPVWAHRHGMEWPLVVFQDGDDRDLSHAMGQSSLEKFYCRPLTETDSGWDTQTCASTPYTDKGELSATQTSLYPPRNDIEYTPGIDDPMVAMYGELNPFDAVSRPTPLGGERFNIDWQPPPELPPGDYVAWVEVSREFDQNEFYSYPEPVGIPWSAYGAPYRGQPSVVYKVPFALTIDRAIVASAAEYAGYGDPDGLDGELRLPDDTITTGVPGSGASRLLLTMDGEAMYRVRVRALPIVADTEMPGVPEGLAMVSAGASSIEASFIAPGDDDDLGTVAGYEVRYLAGETITAENFDRAALAGAQMSLVAPGEVQTVLIPDLLPRLDYSIAIRAYDECRNVGGIAVLQAATTERQGGTVDACFVATAAYGSLMENEVKTLRQFRDRYLRTHVTGELLVQGYYTFGPALARLIGPSDTLRRAARAGLAPMIEAVRELAPAR